jgi:multicomponent Na+:H+ antiporter subunit E
LTTTIIPIREQQQRERRLIGIRLFTVFMLCFIFWILIAQDLNPISLSVAVILSGASALYSFGLFYEEHLRPTARALLRFDLVLIYLVVIMYLSYIAIVDIVIRMLTGNYNPGIVKIRTRLRSPFGRAVLCNTISIVPGTLSLWMEGSTIYVHWFNVETRHSKRATRIITFLIEDILGKIFG